MPEPLPLSDPHIAGLPVHDRGERLVDVRTAPVLRVGPLPTGVQDGRILLRTTVVDRLVVAQSLLPRGLRLIVVEGYRSPAAQERHFRECLADLRDGHPDWTAEQLERTAGRYCAPGGSAPHPTGAAADLTLCTSTGAEVTMGTPIHVGPVESGGACATDAPAIPVEARVNRAILAEVLTAAGLVNLPTAWWHWSYGDRYWCHRTGAVAAPYGPVEI